MTRAVILIVDALGFELACALPGFGAVVPERRRVETVLGFSSGALPTLFSGRLPHEHGRWMMYRRARRATPFAGFRALGLLPQRIQRSWKFGRWLHRWVERRGVRGYFQLYEVPRPLLESFDLAERRDLFAPGGLEVDTLWDSLARRRLPHRVWNWRTPEAAALAEAQAALANGSERVVVVYTADLDAALHREGSSGATVRERLHTYERWLAGLAADARARGDSLWLYLLSDHGMVNVTRHVDVMAAVDRLAVRAPHDFLAFYDSTMARFWWRTPGARDAVRAALGPPLGGHWLTDEELTAGGCRFERREYGEDLFLLDPGVLMVPSFMGSHPVAAMHGYAPSHPDMAALFASNRPLPERLRHLTDVRGFFETELDALASEAS
ncbi:MAG: hypothetical protein HOP12_03810 [Candidatus Eisenbacteria bacterium]|uniref:Alkaline phosphatase family protein n=1 Tax=Eiseniibacteriota bacterium TaxID=2212470 RepID=A0A849SKB3_UNCEI|nr:hypothetical protein [Candidatus Eisenbacteria bacterium]